MNSFIFYISLVSLLDLAGMLSAKMWVLHKQPIYLIGSIVIFAGVGFFFAQLLRYEGIALANAIWASLSALLTLLFGYFVFKENLTAIQLIGITIIIIGLILVNSK